MFVNYRRADTGWAAKLLAEALRRRLGSSSEVFLDTRSIKLGEAFAEALDDGLRRSAVLVVLIGVHSRGTSTVPEVHPAACAAMDGQP